MSTETKFELIAGEIRPHHVGNRTASSALLSWFLETVWRMEPEEAADAICDGGGDKGIDAIEVNEDLQEITIFQAKHRTGPTTTQGDADLRAFIGVATYFADEGGIDSLLSSSPRDEVRMLVSRLDLRTKLEGQRFTVRLVFVTNAPLDGAGRDYVRSRVGQLPTLDVWDRDRLAEVADRTRSLAVQDVRVTLPLSSGMIHEALSAEATIAVALVSATELVRLPGIEDLSIFQLNVRLALGKTRINKELAATIQKPEEHALFPAYHNGLTLLSRSVAVGEGEITLDGVSVVNGCQSLVALYNNRASLTPDLKILVKIIELGSSLNLVDSITYRTNNQNPVNARDLRSTDPIQRDLQQQVEQHYAPSLGYVIRNGEPVSADATIDNTAAAQLVMAVYTKEPWNAVRKVKLFDQEYHRVFSRTIDGHKIYLLHLLNSVVGRKRDALRDDLNASFAAVRLTFLYLLSVLIRQTSEGEALLTSPQDWLPERQDEVTARVEHLADDIVESLNFFVENREEEALENGTLFDAKVVFKSRSGIQPLERDVLTQARRSLRRDPEYGFHVDSK